MEVELFFHGVPSGEDFWGREDDRNYFGTFYDHSSDEVKFLIQTRMLNGKRYCYYNYLVYKTVGSPMPNIVANDGRDGSYFGITLRLEAYCMDILNMYRILDMAFNVYVIGNILKMEKTKLKYMTPGFKNISAALKTIENNVLQLVKKAFSNNSFVSLDKFSMSKGTYTISKFNLYDCTSNNVMSLVKERSCVAVSPFYPSERESAINKQFNAKIQDIQQKYEERMRANDEARTKEKDKMDLSLSSARKQLDQFQHMIKQKDEKISQLNCEVSRMQSEINNIKLSKKVEQILAPIKEPIVELASTLKGMIPETPGRKIHSTDNNQDNGHKKGFSFSILKAVKSFIPFLNLLLLLIIIIAQLNYSKSKTIDNTNVDALIKKMETLVEQNQSQKEESRTTSPIRSGERQETSDSYSKDTSSYSVINFSRDPIRDKN